MTSEYGIYDKIPLKSSLRTKRRYKEELTVVETNVNLDDIITPLATRTNIQTENDPGYSENINEDDFEQSSFNTTEMPNNKRMSKPIFEIRSEKTSQDFATPTTSA